MTHIFLVNPYVGQSATSEYLRTTLAEIKNLNYFVFNTRYEGEEASLVKRVRYIFEGEELRLYCCGGSGTFRNVLNGLENPEGIEIAFLPCGLTNDFLKMFGESEKRFHRIEELVYGDVINVDYIKSNCGACLNTLSLGMDSCLLEKLDQYRVAAMFGKQMPYILALLYSILVSKPAEYEVRIDGREMEGTFAEIFFGNGSVLGGNLYFTDILTNKVNDGKGFHMVAGNHRRLGTLPIVRSLMQKDYARLKKLAYCGDCTEIEIHRKDNRPFQMNMDGELCERTTRLKARIVKGGLRFVVPKGVKL